MSFRLLPDIGRAVLADLLARFRRDPRSITRLVMERLRLASPRFLTPFVIRMRHYLESRSMSSPEINDLCATGHFDDAAETILQSQAHYSAREIRKVIDGLRASTHSSDEIEFSIEGEPDVPFRMLYLLNNSLPHTQSGYTLRSQKIMQALTRQGVECEAVTRLNYPVSIGKVPESKTEQVEGIHYHRMFGRSGVEKTDDSVDQLVTLAQAFKASFLQTTTDYKNAVIVSKAAKKLQVPWYYEVRGELESTWLSRISPDHQDEAEQSIYYRNARRMETAAMMRAAKVIVLSDVYKAELLRRGIPESKIHVVPNGVDIDEINSEESAVPPEAVGFENGDVVLGIVSALVDYEGVDDLIRALDLLPDRFKLLVVGEGVARPALEKLSRDLGLDQRVFFAGRVPGDEVTKWYRLIDIFVVPRKDEIVTRRVTPIKALQAQALKKRVVATDLPALREITGNLAVYARSNSPSDLARAIQEADLLPEHDSSLKWAQEHSWDAVAKQYRSMFATDPTVRE